MSRARNADEKPSTLLRQKVRELREKASSLNEFLSANYPDPSKRQNNRRKAQHLALAYLLQELHLEKGFTDKKDCLVHFQQHRRTLLEAFKSPDLKSLKEEDRLFLLYISRLQEALALAQLYYLRALDRVNYFNLDDKIDQPQLDVRAAEALLKEHDKQFPDQSEPFVTIEEVLLDPSQDIDSAVGREQEKRKGKSSAQEAVEVAKEAYEQHRRELFAPAERDFIEELSICIAEFNEVLGKLHEAERMPIEKSGLIIEKNQNLLQDKFEAIRRIYAELQDHIHHKESLLTQVAMAKAHLKEQKDLLAVTDEESHTHAERFLFQACYDMQSAAAIRDTDSALRRLGWMLKHKMLTPTAACKALADSKSLGESLASELKIGTLTIGDIGRYQDNNLNYVFHLLTACENFEKLLDLKTAPAESAHDKSEMEAFALELFALREHEGVFAEQIAELGKNPHLNVAQFRSRTESAPAAFERKSSPSLFSGSSSSSGIAYHPTTLSKADLGEVNRMIKWLQVEVNKSGNQSVKWHDMEIIQKLYQALMVLPKNTVIGMDNNAHYKAIMAFEKYKADPNFQQFRPRSTTTPSPVIGGSKPKSLRKKISESVLSKIKGSSK